MNNFRLTSLRLLGRAALAATFFFAFVTERSAQQPTETLAVENETAAYQLSRKWDLQSIRDAIDLFRTSAEDWKRFNNPHRTALCLNEAAKLSQMISDHSAAASFLSAAIELENEHALVDERVISLSIFALLSHDKGDNAATRNYAARAIEESQKTESLLPKAYAHFAAGLFHYYHGKLKDAASSFEKAEAFYPNGQDVGLQSQLLLYIGYLHLREGRFQVAMDRMNSALVVSEAADHKRGRALAYFGIGYANFFLNEKQKALDFFRTADSLFPADFEWMEKGRTVSIVGHIYMEFGSLDLARSNYESAIGHYDKIGYLYGKVSALRMLGEIHSQKGEIEASRDFYRRAKQLSESLKDNFELAAINEGLGSLELRQNNPEGAIVRFTEALQTYQDTGVQFANFENLLGKAYEAKGDHGTARKHYSLALKANREIRDSFQLSEALFNLARLDLLADSRDQALENIRESLSLTESMYTSVANSALRRSYFASIHDRYGFYTNLLMKYRSIAGDTGFVLEALRSQERSRARTLVENLRLSGSEFVADADPATLKKEKVIIATLAVKRDLLTDLLSSISDPAEIKRVEDEIRALSHELEEINAELKLKSPVYSAIKDPPQFDLADFQANVLGENDVLLEYFLGADESYLWLVGKSEFEAFVLPGREVIESKVDALRALLEARKPVAGESLEQMRTRVADADARYGSLARELSNMILGPVADKLDGKRLIVVPDGKLHYFGINALPLPNSTSDDPILLSNEVVYEPSAQTLSLLTKFRSRTDATRDRDLLVFSDPVFSRDDARLSRIENEPVAQAGSALNLRFAESLEGLRRLPASGQEAETISGIVGGRATDTFTGFGATRDQLLAAKLSDYKIIHLATHGLIDQDRPELSSVVLSRFDEKGQPRNESIRLQDIYAMKLNADLVVLSACQTAAGKEVKGEGVMGLNTAFLQAGARSVVASLWQVDDDATNLLMKEFYRGMANGRSVSAALRDAQLALYRDPQFRSPFFWGAFTLQGDMNRKPDIGSGVSVWWLAGLSAAVIVVGILVWRRRRKVSHRA